MHRRLTAVLLAVALAFAACGGDDEPEAATDGATDGATDSTAAADGDDAADASFPVTVTAENGDVEIPARPERIVSLSPSLTEMLFAVGAGEQVVAVDQYSDHPDGTPVTDLSGFRPNLEAIGGYEPDLVVLASDRDGAVGALENLDIPTLLLSSADSLDDVGSQIDTLGEATGHADEADRLAADLREELDEIAATARARDEPVRYFYELSDSLHSVTSESFIGELLGLAGMESIADGADPAAGAFPQLSNEYVLDADPDIVFLAHTDGTGLDPGEVAGRPGWSELRAVQDGHVVVLEPDVASRWGPRIVDLLREAIDATRELDG